MIVHLQNKMLRNDNQMLYLQKSKLQTASSASVIFSEQWWYEHRRDFYIDGKNKKIWCFGLVTIKLNFNEFKH